MRKLYLALVVLPQVAVLLQFYFAAVGAFTQPPTDGSYDLHRMTGDIVIPALSILATLAAVAAKAPGRLIGMSILPLGLVAVQMLIVALGKALSDGDATTPAALLIFGLHALNGLAVLAVAGILTGRVRRFALAPRSASVQTEAVA